MSYSSEIAKFYSEAINIKRDQNLLNKEKEVLAKKIITHCGDMDYKKIFKLLVSLVGPYYAIKLYNNVMYDGLDVVKSKREIQKIMQGKGLRDA